MKILKWQQIIDIYDRLDVAAKNYPIKALATDIRSDTKAAESKAESTLRGELNRTEGAKLSLQTALQVLFYTGDYSALDAIEKMFGRVAFDIPRAGDQAAVELLEAVAGISKEYAEVLDESAKAVHDGEISKQEALDIINETEDVIVKCLKLQASMRAVVSET